jgi:predicted DNA-binding protein
MLDGIQWCIMVSVPKIRMNIYLSAKQKGVLERLSTKTGAPIAELVRRAIDAYLLSRKKELK